MHTVTIRRQAKNLNIWKKKLLCQICVEKKSVLSYHQTIHMTDPDWASFLTNLALFERQYNTVLTPEKTYATDDGNFHLDISDIKKSERVHLHAIKAHRRSRGIAPLIPNLCTRRGQWSTLSLGRFTPGKEPRYPLNRRLGGPQSRSEGVCEPLYLSYYALIMFMKANVSSEWKTGRVEICCQI